MNISRVTPQSVFNNQSKAVNYFVDGNYKNLIYEHQANATKSIEIYLSNTFNDDTALCVIPTGCGKTGIAVLSAYATNSNRVLVVTPSQIISYQVNEAFSDKNNSFLMKQKIVQSKDINKVLPPSGLIKKSSELEEKTRNCFIVVNAHKIGGKSSVKIEEIQDDFDLVIVDEAHHYPAQTWKLLVDHFKNAKKIFLTATPYYRGKYILENKQPCYELSKSDAINKGIIREFKFIDEKDELLNEEKKNEVTEEIALKWIAKKVKEILNEHDTQDSDVFHQAMILTQTKNDINSSERFNQIYNENIQNDKEKSCLFVSDTPKKLLQQFSDGSFRTLIIIGRLLEGYDNNKVSICAIARNVQKSSRVLFSQFIGRGCRKSSLRDPVKATIISHSYFGQKVNFEQFEQLPDDDILYDDIDE